MLPDTSIIQKYKNVLDIIVGNVKFLRLIQEI